MNQTDQEIEVKFYLANLPALEQRIIKAGGILVQPRVHEVNLRFDLPDGSLTADKRVLRLREDVRSVLTYKGPSAAGQTVNVRQEIETDVSDFAAAQRIIEALGYQVAVMYEKWRTTYQLEDLEIVLDELPYGVFCEIEGPDAESIRSAAAGLRLNWGERITDSYLGMFWRLKANLNLAADHLDFQSFSGITIRPQDLAVKYADKKV
ncbi:MAG TPA: class IV adenylate cyclase [Bellilinea sp.]